MTHIAYITHYTVTTTHHAMQYYHSFAYSTLYYIILYIIKIYSPTYIIIIHVIVFRHFASIFWT